MWTGWCAGWAPQPQAAVLAVLSAAGLWLNGLANGLKPICAATTATSQVWAYTGVVMSRPAPIPFKSSLRSWRSALPWRAGGP